MLTTDLVRAYRRGNQLVVPALKPEQRTRALELATAYLELMQNSVGASRDELEARTAVIELAPQERRLAAGLLKLVTDRCAFAMPEGHDPSELRLSLFARASAARQQQSAGDRFEREQVVAAAAAEFELQPAQLEAMLYADLKGAQRLTTFKTTTAEALVESYDLAQVQAVLLRAVKVVATVRSDHSGSLRALFHKLKFLRLLHSLHAADDGGTRIEIDGPYSLFTQVTKYGLQLALLLPALTECGSWELEAEVLWGKARVPLQFKTGGEGRAPAALGASPARKRVARLPDEVARLVKQFEALESPWKATRSKAVLDLPGIGLCVPDLAFRHAETGEQVYLEVLGYWSRAAVWRRVELVEAGLPQRIVFAVSERLRVSEAVLPADLPGSLYVYKGTMHAPSLLRKFDRAPGPK